MPWLWHRPSAEALIHSLAWELPYAAGAAVKRKQTNKQTKKTYILGGFEAFESWASKSENRATAS